jgi:hypothetical protein
MHHACVTADPLQQGAQEMQTVQFKTLPLGAEFFDYAYSGMWMRKLDEDSARWADGLIGCVAADCLVQITDETARDAQTLAALSDCITRVTL